MHEQLNLLHDNPQVAPKDVLEALVEAGLVAPKRDALSNPVLRRGEPVYVITA
jgi:hypothetical protein